MFDRLRSFLPTFILAALIVYFGSQAMIGPRGLLLVRARHETLRGKQVEWNQLDAQRQELETRSHLLRDNSLSANLLEERARYLLGVADPRDYVIRTKP
jgi:cell division protein FtsB